METLSKKQNSTYLALIGVASVAVPLLVSLLLFMPQTGKLGDLDVSFLPHFNAVLNSFTAICLLSGFYFIKNKQIDYHKLSMTTAFILSSLFLISYIVYHFQTPPTKFEGEGWVRGLYFFLLITHIILATVVVPFVLLAFYFALSKQIERHKKIVKWTFPIWTYVAITGVIVYLMIKPYYLK